MSALLFSFMRFLRRTTQWEGGLGLGVFLTLTFNSKKALRCFSSSYLASRSRRREKSCQSQDIQSHQSFFNYSVNWALSIFDFSFLPHSLFPGCFSIYIQSHFAGSSRWVIRICGKRQHQQQQKKLRNCEIGVIKLPL